jgi:ribosomal protein S18 acetylase RimI-like enzyme
MIRAAGLDDANQIAALVRTSFDSRLHDFMVYAQDGIERFLAVHIDLPTAEPRRHFLVDVDEDGSVRGFAEFVEGTGSAAAFLSYICVAPQARGAGIATALINHFVAATGSSALQLDVFRENHAAVALYRKLGFERVSATGWFVRDLPPPASAPTLHLINPAEAVAMHEYYGFCRHTVRWGGAETVLGRIGPRTLRCFNGPDFSDVPLLAAARALFPETRRALFVCSMDAADRPAHAELFHTSLRLVRAALSDVEN